MPVHTQDQMQLFAAKRRVAEPKTFVDEIERNDALLFATRPQDLQDLIDFWQEHKRIGKRLELIRASVTTKLKERDPDRARLRPLADGMALPGIRMLAAAATFQRLSRICLPDAENLHESVDATAILPKWSRTDVGTLLGRPVFDQPIYGTVRFHHRLIREYLTAEWLLELLQDGKSRSAIDALLFREHYGVTIATPTVRPLLPWLAMWDDQILARTLSVAPEALLEGGDPSQLPVDSRRTILNSFCRLYAERTRGHHLFDLAALQRFAHQDLAKDISQLIRVHIGNSEIAFVLLAMIWKGHITDCFEDARRCATDPLLDGYTRVGAIRAAVATAPSAAAVSLRDDILRTIAAKDEMLFGTLLDELAPTLLPANLVLESIDRLTPPSEFQHRHVDGALERYVDRCDLGDLRQLITGLLPSLQKAPFIDSRYCKVSSRNLWLLKVGCRAVERLATDRHDDALVEPALTIISLMSQAQHYRNYDTKNNILRELVAAWPRLNCSLFWHDVAVARSELDTAKGERLTEQWQVRTFRDYTSFTAGDFDSILVDVQRRELLDDRLVALSVAFALYISNRRPTAWRAKLQRAVVEVPELATALHSFFHPPAESEDLKRYKRHEVDRARRRRLEAAQDTKQQDKWKNWLKTNTHVLRDVTIASKGSVWNGTRYLIDYLRDKGGNTSQWSCGKWRDLAADFGTDVARAYRDGAAAYWRGFTPKLRSEGVENPNSIPNAIIVGLSGLEIEADETQDWVTGLNSNEVELACRYALWEMNGLPAWIPQLYSGHSQLVADLFLRELRWELIESSSPELGYVISKIQYYASWLKDDIAPALLKILADKPTTNRSLTTSCLSMVLDCAGIPDAEIAIVAKARSSDRTGQFGSLWFATWASVESEPALTALEKMLSADPEKANGFAMEFAVALLGDRRNTLGRLRGSHRKPQQLLRLYRLLHEYIRCDDDIDRIGGGTYSPTLRDDAQHARDRVFGLLKEIPGKDSYLALRSIAAMESDNSERRLWLDYHARSKAEADSDASLGAWKTLDVLSFCSEYERKPQTQRDLFDLAVARLHDLKSDIETGDTSIASLLMKSSDETEYRKYVGHWLRERSLSRYSVPQEEELADAKRPDLRMHGHGFDGPVPIELKIADKWRGPVLFERLEIQLCGDYLRDHRSTCGIYLLINRGTKARWRHPKTSRLLNFVDLIEALQEHASLLVHDQVGLERVQAIGIDLTVRGLS